MAECEGGCKTWVHLKCHKIQLGDDWFCDKCRQAVQSSKAHSDDLDDPMNEPAEAAGADPCNAPSRDALIGAAPGAKKGRAASRSPGVSEAARRPDTDEEGLRAAGGSPDGSSAAEDIELDLSPTASPAVKTSSKKFKKVNIYASSNGSGRHLLLVTLMLQKAGGFLAGNTWLCVPRCTYLQASTQTGYAAKTRYS